MMMLANVLVEMFTFHSQYVVVVVLCDECGDI